jgi:hypothetical protein
MDSAVARLIALGTSGVPGSDLELTREYMTLGRSHSNDLVITEPTVSRVHAALTVDHDGQVSVQDLGSSAGTNVNGRPASRRVVLHPGDVISFGLARFQYQGKSGQQEATAALPAQRKPRPQPRGEQAQEHPVQGQYDIENQHAGNISNVAGNQYTAYVSHIRQERESFLQAVAATRTKARWLIWIGVGVTVAGLIIAVGSFYQLMDGIPNLGSGGAPAPFRSYLTGLVIAGAGQILLIIGVVLHVVATSRRKRVDREFPLPRPRGY